MNSISTIQAFIENLYYLSGVALALVAIYGLKQLHLLKSDLNFRSERASKERAIEAVSDYLGPFVDLVDSSCSECNLKKGDEKCPKCLYKGEISDFTIASLTHEEAIYAHNRCSSGLRKALNRLESISAIFVSGVGDEKTAYPMIGRSFCNNVENYYDVISAFRAEDPSPFWVNIVSLYNIWSSRVSKEDIRKESDLLRQKLDTIPDSSILPIRPRFK